MPLRAFRWLPHNGKRHAVGTELTACHEATTLCGEQLTIPEVRPTKEQWCWPTCQDCDAHWRTAEGIPPFPRQANSSRRSTRADASAVERPASATC